MDGWGGDDDVPISVHMTFSFLGVPNDDMVVVRGPGVPNRCSAAVANVTTAQLLLRALSYSIPSTERPPLSSLSTDDYLAANALVVHETGWKR
jgi:hypothetical protein